MSVFIASQAEPGGRGSRMVREHCGGRGWRFPGAPRPPGRVGCGRTESSRSIGPYGRL